MRDLTSPRRPSPLHVGLTMAAALAVSAAVLASCSTYEMRAEWRDPAERACLRSGEVQPSPVIQAVGPLHGDGACGATRPFQVGALADGSVALGTSATLGCPMVAAVEGWLTLIVQPAAAVAFGAHVVGLTVISSYSCRRINGSSQVSEHGFANAIDISAFVLSDGRRVSVLDGWRGSGAEQAFLREVSRGACSFFMTVLGPEYNADHRDHFHLDLALRNIGVCK